VKRHQIVVDDVLKDMSDAPAIEGRAGTRFLNRATALADAAAREEKTLRWVLPEDCVMWDRHNRAYGLLTARNCADLIDSIRAQGRQEFPAIVRARAAEAGQGARFEVICGARRHFAISWLRANNYPQFRYLVEVRELTDEEAFRLADVENRDREDLSDFERAVDYAQALDRYYGGRQKAMAARLEVSEAWLSRYLELARLPPEIVAAFPSLREIRELHARTLKPLLADPTARAKLLAEAEAIVEGREAAPISAADVLTRLKAAGQGASRRREQTRRPPDGDLSAPRLTVRKRRGVVTMEFPDSMPTADLREAFERYVASR
jgi:ParB family transcriptional regulator, chromosome partitioning protein